MWTYAFWLETFFYHLKIKIKNTRKNFLSITQLISPLFFWNLFNWFFFLKKFFNFYKIIIIHSCYDDDIVYCKKRKENYFLVSKNEKKENSIFIFHSFIFFYFYLNQEVKSILRNLLSLFSPLASSNVSNNNAFLKTHFFLLA